MLFLTMLVSCKDFRFPNHEVIVAIPRNLLENVTPVLRSLACTTCQCLERGNSLGKQKITLPGSSDAIGLKEWKSDKLGTVLDDFSCN